MPTYDELWLKSGDVSSADARMFYEGGYDEAEKDSKTKIEKLRSKLQTIETLTRNSSEVSGIHYLAESGLNGE
jgi:hypothetical protein